MSAHTGPQGWLASGLLFGSLMVLFVLTTIPQPQADPLAYLGLASGLLLSLAALATFTGIQVRRLIHRRPLDQAAYQHASRQGVEIAVVTVGSLYLRGLTGVSWWEVSLLAAAVSTGELALAMRRRPTEERV
ncbi:hypothetical protein HY524_01755 [Candidatus Berkelbacteria bacterium]|nr:hypothetical protein [Candidatus Berkelbacteria bacterium]